MFFGFLTDDRLKITDHRGVWVRTSHGADAIERVTHVGHPVAQRIVHCIFQGATTGSHGHHFCTKKAHTEHVRGLTLDIMCAHIDHTFQTEFRTNRGRCNTVLACTCLGNDAGLAHAAGQNDLAQHIVDFMRASMVQFVALHIDFRTTQMRS